jgi:hypothetical protein
MRAAGMPTAPMKRWVFSETDEKYTRKGLLRPPEFNVMNFNVSLDEVRATLTAVSRVPPAPNQNTHDRRRTPCPVSPPR